MRHNNYALFNGLDDLINIIMLIIAMFYQSLLTSKHVTYNKTAKIIEIL